MPFGSSASLIARKARSSAGERVRCTQRRFAVPMPCSALIEPCRLGDEAEHRVGDAFVVGRDAR